jgi:EmrB/QacA subfamily drug resistance transporter
VANELSRRRRSLALFFLCLAVLMIILDTTIVTVSLPSILADLRVSGTLTWVLNAYMLTFGGFLLLSGRLGDLYGRRRLFLAGVSIFTLASLACGLAQSEAALLISRAVQGLGGAVVAAVSLSLLTSLFSRPSERARAIGMYGLVCAAGGGVGELLGGLITKTLGWHWIFLVNVPIGATVYVSCVVILPRDAPSQGPRQLDVSGAVAITTALTLLVYALVNGNASGWTSAQTKGLASVVALLLLLFLSIESRVREPLMPLTLFRLRNFTIAIVLRVMWAAGTFGWFVISALYLQRVLNYDSFRVGLAFAPAEVVMATFSAGLSASMVMRFGIRLPLWSGLLLAAAGLALFARAPLDGAFAVDILPGMLFLGLGAGMSSTPLLLAAMNDVNSDESGLASGVLNTSFMLGGSLGLAALSSLAELRTAELQRHGAEAVAALNGGYHLAFLVSALLTATAAVVGALMLRPGPPTDAVRSRSVALPG